MDIPRLSKSKLKFFASLQLKKFRQSEQLYLAEGKKVLEEALKSGLLPELVVVREDLLPSFDKLLESLPKDRLLLASAKDLSRLSSQKNPEGISSIFPFPEAPRYYFGPAETPPQGPALLLHQVRDPGNLGTLIRTADWFGFKTIVCSTDCAELFNPKVIRSSMGSAFRLQIHYYEDFNDFLSAQASQIWVADMDGNNPRKLELPQRPYILLGNEAKGIPEEIKNLDGLESISIPQNGAAESLNVAIAGGILCYEYRQQC